VLFGLRALLDHFRRHANRARRDFAQRRGQHVCACGCCCDSLVHGVVELFFHPLVGDEEQGRARRGAYDCAADSIVDSAEAARGPEAG
jgi:hypothetical protein